MRKVNRARGSSRPGPWSQPGPFWQLVGFGSGEETRGLGSRLPICLTLIGSHQRLSYCLTWDRAHFWDHLHYFLLSTIYFILMAGCFLVIVFLFFFVLFIRELVGLHAICELNSDTGTVGEMKGSLPQCMSLIQQC